MLVEVSDKEKFLRLYPFPWPNFSTKNYIKTQDGWWKWNPKKRFRRSEKIEI